MNDPGRLWHVTITLAGDPTDPALVESALERLANGEASCLVVAQLGRLSRSAAELARILDWLKQRGPLFTRMLRSRPRT